MLAALAASGCDDAPSVAAMGPDIRADGTLLVAATWEEPIALPAAGAALTLSCVVEHPDGTREEVPSAKVRSLRGAMTGTCAELLPHRSGVDTLEVSAQGLRARLAVAVALPPEVQSGPVGTFLAVDSVPGGIPWAPTLRRASDGILDLYVGSISGNQESLVRLRLGADNVFRYDATIFTPPQDACTPFGTGFEHVAVVPRAEGPGWRMLFTAGSPCHGWQVYSAVSPDERKWTVEPGVRVSNGEHLLWSQGEGLVVDQLPDGEWRMIVGGIAPATPPRSNVYEILEWRSRDQLTWSYTGPVLGTADMPEGANGSVYSPAIRAFAPGLYRMVFTADNRDGPGPSRSALWTAVSTDRRRWQVERELLGAPGTNLYYSSLVDDMLVTIRIDEGQVRSLARATVRMP